MSVMATAERASIRVCGLREPQRAPRWCRPAPDRRQGTETRAQACVVFPARKDGNSVVDVARDRSRRRRAPGSFARAPAQSRRTSERLQRARLPRPGEVLRRDAWPTLFRSARCTLAQATVLTRPESMSSMRRASSASHASRTSGSSDSAAAAQSVSMNCDSSSGGSASASFSSLRVRLLIATIIPS